MAERKKNRGAKSLLTESLIERAYQLARKGFLKKQIYESLNISYQTMHEYQKNCDFSDALKRGYSEYEKAKEQAIQERINRVEDAAYKRAEGYTTKESKWIYRIMKDGTEKLVKKETKEVHIPADTNMQKFMLLNKKPKDYQEHVDVSGRLDGRIVIEVKRASEEAKKRGTDENPAGSK